MFYLRLGSKAEAAGDYQIATLLYRRVYEAHPSAPDTEMALLRGARLSERMNADPKVAAPLYAEMLRLFPHGPQSDEARNALRRLGVSAPVPAAPGAAAPPVAAAPPQAPAPTFAFSPGNGLVPAAAPSISPIARHAADNAPPVRNDDLAPVGGYRPAPTSSAADDDLRPLGS